MDGFSERIGLGCGRLGGGVAESNSRRLVAAAVECGIRYFDTSPSYGGGESERILGRALRDLRGQVQLCTKVGLERSAPNAAAALRTAVLSKIRLVLPEAAVRGLNRMRREQAQRRAAPGNYGNFDPSFVRASLQRSLQELETDYVDCLMLHEPRMSDPDEETLSALRELASTGTALRLGVATGAELDRLPRFGDVAQFKIGSALPSGIESRILIGHGLLRGLFPEKLEACARESGIFYSIPALNGCVAEPLGPSALLLNAALYGARLERVLISTTSPKRLKGFMAAAGRIFAEIESRGIADCEARFADILRRYFARNAEAA
jgi:predicted component of type VI protein secretion system